MGTEEMLTVTFQNSSRLSKSGSERRETVWDCDLLKRMCLELVKNTGRARAFLEVTSQDEISYNLRV